MKIGLGASALLHLGFLLWMLGGQLFSPPSDFDAVTVTDVSIISADEFEAAQPSGPETGEEPPALQAPDTSQPAPALTEVETPETPPAPQAVAEVQPDTTPQPLEAPLQPQVIEPETPELLNQPEGDPGASIVVPDAPQPTPRAADIIAQQVTEAPEPEVQIDDVVQREVAPDASADVVQEDAQQETAPEETTTQVVTEADEPSDQAPTRSARPGRKPTPPPAPAPTEVAEDPAPQPTVPGLAESIAGAVSEANSETAVADNANPGGGNGTPITRAEKGAFILAIGKCWNVGALSTDALKVSVVVGFAMTPDAKPEIGSIRLVSAEGGVGSAVERAYEAARRAIIRCGAAGFGLPADKYDQWRGVEVKFNATTKEIR